MHLIVTAVACFYNAQVSAFSSRALHINPNTVFRRSQGNGGCYNEVPQTIKRAYATKSFSSILPIESFHSISNVISDVSTFFPINLDITRDEAEALAGPFFGLSLFPYLAFLYLLDVPENDTPKGVTVGFATCLLFVFLTIPAAIGAQVMYGVSLADSDWLHGSAESLLTVTNLVTVVAFRQALAGKEEQLNMAENGNPNAAMPISATSYDPMIKLVTGLTALAGLTAFVPILLGPEIHTPYLGGL